MLAVERILTYIYKGGVLYDVTPAEDSGNLSNAFAVTSGSSTVTVTDSAHGLLDGNRIILGAASFNGLSWSKYTEFTVTVVNTNTYTFTAAQNASSSGVTVGAQFRISTY